MSAVPDPPRRCVLSLVEDREATTGEAEFLHCRHMKSLSPWCPPEHQRSGRRLLIPRSCHDFHDLSTSNSHVVYIMAKFFRK
ncbi:hypothetical protein AVEN_189463-1 [Araneus ventricosus]|uniref:Uncharacterized protein n=1 Tax=Araneus ventricosus TaxID=182803 RepID=A0A4Y2SQS4_ARAVE|nr:hypothetical protein AVEN_189463-1 [Araneus ventricosus]